MDFISEQQDIFSCIIEPDAKNKGGLYLSSLKAAKNNEKIQELNIKTVLTVLAGTKLVYSPELVNLHLKISAYDNTSYDISSILDLTYNFIEEGFKEGNTLVHCHAGLSRSASVIVAYIMKKYNFSYMQAYDYVMKKRKILPNSGFVEQLKKYEKHLESQKLNKTPKL